MAYQFSTETEKKYNWLLTRYPKKDAVLLPLLRAIQIEEGWLRPEIIDYVASRLDFSPARIKEVASFYSMFKLNNKGKYTIQICHTLSCYLRGSDELLARLEDILGVPEGVVTPDGKFSFERVECLASCGTAPAMQINEWDFHEDLTLEKMEKVIEALKKDQYASPSYDQRITEGGIA